jgi:hypothetical protein
MAAFRAYRPTLKRVGSILVGAGLIDIAWMIYCIVHKMSYKSSLNLFAIVAGVLLMRGSLRTAAIVRWFGIFFLTASIAMLIAWPAMQPLDLTLTRIRLNPVGFVVSAVLVVFLFALLYWVIRELGRDAVRVAIDSAGLKRRDMRLPAALGIAFVIVLGISLSVLLRGASAERAKSMAEDQAGYGYKFHVSSLRISRVGDSESASGVVTAWNDKEIKDIPVHWEDSRN